ncbi:hypothetical protein PS3A_30480 [Pseudomonas sp. 3A(2025)]
MRAKLLNFSFAKGQDLDIESEIEFIRAAETMSRLSTLIANAPDRENCVIEIWSGSHQFAEVSHGPGSPIEIEIYPPAGEDKWNLDPEALMAALHQSADNLASQE